MRKQSEICHCSPFAIFHVFDVPSDSELLRPLDLAALEPFWPNLQSATCCFANFLDKNELACFANFLSCWQSLKHPQKNNVVRESTICRWLVRSIVELLAGRYLHPHNYHHLTQNKYVLKTSTSSASTTPTRAGQPRGEEGKKIRILWFSSWISVAHPRRLSTQK